jgi:hypothetical protein
MNILYPCDPFNKLLPDAEYLEEFTKATQAGINCFLFSLEDLVDGKFKIFPKLTESNNYDFLYRGWMLSIDEYKNLFVTAKENKVNLIVDPATYQSCHYLPEWYSLCKNHTPETIIISKTDDVGTALSKVNWKSYFVKDYVKSLTTSRGSIAKSVEEVEEIIKLIEHYRGKLEGGICIREVESFQVDTEDRYFVFKGKVYSNIDIIPEFVQNIASVIKSPFFSIDTIYDKNENMRLIEIGDGQVSDKKKWNVDKFISMLVC